MWDAIRRLAAERVTIFLTTQYRDEADELANRIAVLDRGRIVAEGTPGELKRRIPGGHIRLGFTDPDALHAAQRALATASRAEDDLILRVPNDGNGAALRGVLEQLDDAGVEIAQLSIHTPDLDDVFFAVTRHPRRAGGGPAMSALTYTVTDSATMLRRNLRRLRRYPAMTLLLVGMPIVFLLLFVYVFGGQLGAGLGRGLTGSHTGRAGYVNYVTPGILLMTVAAAVQGTAIVVAMDMTGGIIDRFRTMAIARSCVPTGHVLASLIQTFISILVVLGVAAAIGFRPTADAASWLAAIGVLALFALALICLATALGLGAKSVETASNTPMFLTLLPFLGRLRPRRQHARRPAAARDLPALHATETLRGLLTGTPTTVVCGEEHARIQEDHGG
jgi:ABC-2 type transport system permease protein